MSDKIENLPNNNLLLYISASLLIPINYLIFLLYIIPYLIINKKYSLVADSTTYTVKYFKYLKLYFFNQDSVTKSGQLLFTGMMCLFFAVCLDLLICKFLVKSKLSNVFYFTIVVLIIIPIMYFSESISVLINYNQFISPLLANFYLSKLITIKHIFISFFFYLLWLSSISLIKGFIIKDKIKHQEDEFTDRQIKSGEILKNRLTSEEGSQSVFLGNVIIKDLVIKPIKKLVPRKNLIYLGVSLRTLLPIFFNKINFKLPTHIMGNSGSGKSALGFRFINEDIKNNEPVIIFDGKGEPEYIKTIYNMCVENGREEDFRLVSMSEPDISNTWNPFFTGDHTAILDRLITLVDWENAHYKRRTVRATSNVILTLKSTNKAFRLSDIAELIYDADYYKKVINSIKDVSIKKILIKGYEQTNFKDEDFLTIAEEAMIILNTSYGKILNSTNPDIDLYNDTQKNKRVVLFSVDSNQYLSSSRFFGRLLLVSMQQLSSQMNKLSNRNDVSFYVEEADVVAIKELELAANKFRSKGIRLTISHQEASQLTSSDDKDKLLNCITTNTSNKFHFQQLDKLSVESSSDIYGTVKRVEYTNVTDHDDFGNVTVMDKGSASVKNVMIAHPDQFKRLKRGECFMYVRYDAYDAIVHDKLKLDFVDFKEFKVSNDVALKLNINDNKKLLLIIEKHKLEINKNNLDKFINEAKEFISINAANIIIEQDQNLKFFTLLGYLFCKIKKNKYGEVFEKSYLEKQKKKETPEISEEAKLNYEDDDLIELIKESDEEEDEEFLSGLD
jgi:hypothetical protein